MKKNVTIANFNVTFGDEDRPLLEYFETILYPALTSNLRRNYRLSGANDKYYFLDIELVEDLDGDFTLTGKLVKETIVEVKSKMQGDQLISADEKYPSAPYSVFYIYLKNHRMILIKNQKESPDIKSFKVTVREILSKYVKGKNQEIKNKGEGSFLPYARVEVVGIPMRKDIEVILRDVKKIRKLKMRMFPLNGDLKLNGIVQGLSNDMRRLTGSKTGNITLNSPESKTGVVELVDASQGVFETTIEVEYDKGDKGVIKDNEYSGQANWNLTEQEINDSATIIPKMKELESIKLVSEDNKKIYDRFKDVLTGMKNLIIKKDE